MLKVGGKDMNIQVNVGVGLRSNSRGRAIVKNVSYDPCEESSIGREEIKMETMDGKICKWSISDYCRIRYQEFCDTRENVLSGKITTGTEVTIVYNPNGILAFVL